jgi:hypothetical protein
MGYIDPDLLHSNLDSLIAYVTDNSAALTAKGLNATMVQTNLTAINGDLTTKKTARDNQKTQLTVSQQAFAASAATNYTAFSNAVDTVAGGRPSPTIPSARLPRGWKVSAQSSTPPFFNSRSCCDSCHFFSRM